MRKRNVVLSCLLSLAVELAAAGDIHLVFESSEGAFVIATPAAKTTLVVDEEDAEVVATAAEMLAGDIAAVTGQQPEVATAALSEVGQKAGGSEPIIAGTLGQSPLIDALAAAGKIDAEAVRDRWEVYGLQMVEAPAEGMARALVVYGSTPRGTAYGLLELSRRMGVSPYIWWADVAPAQHEAVYAVGTKSISSEPSVRYRGIFINDEDWGLTPWAAKNLDKKYNNIGPGTYARVMDLLLRLRANTLWPAMHSCSQAFWDNKDNLPVAKKYDIMLGSSHCEQMLRDNEWEWRRAPWNGTNEDWNYVTNTKKIQQYWEERTQESAGYDAMYTLGMRGVHDWGISGYPSTEDKVRGLTDIIAFQRSLIQKHIGDPTQVPQLFIPYKEVLDAYNAGLQVPEDVTLCWVDDNHGYIRQLPVAKEQARSGGNGVYYHVSYWGTPHDYLWLCSHSPSLISYELSRAYAQGVRTLWVINVGDIKPAEAELEFCMDLAWDIDAWTPEHAYEYSRHWAAETFGEELADDIAAIKREYYRLAAGGKPEHVFAVSYTRAEKDRRIADYAALAARVDEVKAAVPSTLTDAYYQLIEYPVKGAYNMNVKTFRAAESLELAACGQREQALAYAAEARTAYRQIGTLTSRYNGGIAHGKWNGIMSSAPRGLDQFKTPTAATESSIASLTVPLPEEPADTILPATAYSKASEGIVALEGLGVSDHSVSIWPLDMTKYTASRAPYLEYDIPVQAGENTIAVRCLPTFPVNTGYDLRVALSIDGGSPKTISLKTTATEGKWNQTVLQGYNDATTTYTAKEAGKVRLRVALMDPGVVVSDVRVSLPVSVDLSLTERLIQNYDFELNHDCVENAQGNIGRGVPCGWNQKGVLKKGSNGLDSYGVNQDATNYHGGNVCWFNSNPMPADFELSQTIPAAELEPGTYRVRCLLWLEEGKKTTCRLFANQYVQYYGYKSDYTNLLTAGEVNSYAGYAGGQSNSVVLREMQVYVVLQEGEDLTFGIKTSNRKNDGSQATDNSGWFKCDYFRIEKVETTSVRTTAMSSDADTNWYSLDGQRLPGSTPRQRGVFIQNRKKVAVL
ncbi:MAG: glycosyl hydrolase 115 family protein [Bacteroidaceae bacterium]|nr:glycosyl hydrolase 115 family protein [Bacteroidaceae bacterium]